MKIQIIILLLVGLIILECTQVKNKSKNKDKLRNKSKNKTRIRQKNKNKNNQRFQFDKTLKKYTFQDDDDDEDKEMTGKVATEIDPAKQLQSQMDLLKSKNQASQVFRMDNNMVDTPSLIMEGGVELSTDYSNLEATKECEIKQGYLALVTSINMSKYKNDKGQTSIGQNPVLTAKSMFAVLNKQSLSLFDKEHVNSLYKVLDIVHLKPAYYPSTFGDLNCFQLVGENQVKMNIVSIIRKVQYLPMNKVMATLCAVNKETMEEWAEAISTFHNCNVEVAQNDVVETKTIFDVLKDQKTVLKRRLKDQQNLSDSEAKEDDSLEIAQIQKELEDIKAQILKEKVKQSQEKRTETIKLEQEIKNAQETQQKQDCIQKVMAIQQEEEENEVEQMITKESETKEELSLQQKKQRILDLLKKQGIETKNAQMSIEEAIEKMNEDMKYNMVQTVQQYQKVLDPTMCYFAEYGFPSEIKSKADKYKYVCTRMIEVSELDIEQINNCLIPSYFCDVCCEYNFGAAKQKEREQCVDKCSNKAQFGKPNVFKLSYTIVPNNLKIAQLNKAMQQIDIADQNRLILDGQKQAAKPSLKPLPNPALAPSKPN